MRAVAADHPIGDHRPLARLAGASDPQLHPVDVLSEISDVHTPLDRHAEALQLLVQDPLCLILAQREDERIGRVDAVKTDPHRFAPPRVNRDAIHPMTKLEKLLHQSELVEDLERSRLDPERPRLLRA